MTPVVWLCGAQEVDCGAVGTPADAADVVVLPAADAYAPGDALPFTGPAVEPVCALFVGLALIVAGRRLGAVSRWLARS